MIGRSFIPSQGGFGAVDSAVTQAQGSVTKSSLRLQCTPTVHAIPKSIHAHTLDSTTHICSHSHALYHAHPLHPRFPVSCHCFVYIVICRRFL